MKVWFLLFLSGPLSKQRVEVDKYPLKMMYGLGELFRDDKTIDIIYQWQWVVDGRDKSPGRRGLTLRLRGKRVLSPHIAHVINYGCQRGNKIHVLLLFVCWSSLCHPRNMWQIIISSKISSLLIIAEYNSLAINSCAEHIGHTQLINNLWSIGEGAGLVDNHKKQKKW